MWDRDTLKDESQLNASTFDLILGQFPHHGQAYYEKRILRLSKLAKPKVEDLNDLAVACVRLKRFEEGEGILTQALKIDPERYETLSNLGVTAKKSGDFKKGAEFIKQALAKKPEGHMGLGNWYLKALEWRAENEKKGEGNPPKSNFLGVAYSESFDERAFGGGKAVKARETELREEKMIRNDQSFADGFAVLGDRLVLEKDLNLAFLAYTRAMSLGHQNPVEIRRRRRTFLKHAEYYIQGGGPSQRGGPRGVDYWKAEIAKAEKMIAAGGAWLEKFKSVEGELVAKVADERAVTFAKVEEKMKKREISRVKA